MDRGDDSSSDDSGIDAGHEVSSATTPTCAGSPGFCSSNEGKIKNSVSGGEDVGGSVAVALNLQERRDSIWLDVDHFRDSPLEFEVGTAEDKSQMMEDIEDKSGPMLPRTVRLRTGPKRWTTVSIRLRVSLGTEMG